MTSTIATAPRHPRGPGPAWGTDAETTAPIPRLPAASHERTGPRPPRRRRVRVSALAALAVVVLVGTGFGAYLLGTRQVVVPASVAVADPRTAAAPQSATSKPTAPAAVDSGPQLFEPDGKPIDSAIAAQARNVYTALQQDDMSALRAAYGADGSDDGLTAEPHLTSAAVRTKLLAALRTHPIHSGSTYRYRAGDYGLEFNQAMGDLDPGLGSITGPWSANTAASSDNSSTGSTTTTTSSRPKSSTASGGDGCGPYEHNIGNWCSPDTDVLDANGNPDPSKAEVPGNLR